MVGTCTDVAMVLKGAASEASAARVPLARVRVWNCVHALLGLYFRMTPRRRDAAAVTAMRAALAGLPHADVHRLVQPVGASGDRSAASAHEQSNQIRRIKTRQVTVGDSRPEVRTCSTVT